MPVWEQHNAEIAAPGDRALLAPDWAKFDNIADNGEAHWVTVRHFGNIVGYAFVIVSTHLHRKNTLCGFFDLYWLNKDYRKGTGAGKRLIRTVEETLKARGVVRSFIGTKVWYNIGPLLERMGYSHVEELYARAL